MAIKISGTTVIDDSRNANVGVITATSFVGSGSGLTGVGLGSTGNINTSGIITAATVSANEFIGTGDKLIFSPTITSFSPTDGATGVSALSSPNIILTYNQPVGLGTTGTITLRTVSAAGTITESFSVGVSTRVTLSNQTLTIDPTNNFDYDTEYFTVLPVGVVTNFVRGNSALLNTYNFTTEAGPTLSSVSPGIGSTNVGLTSNIVFTFNKNIRAGVGTITLRTVSAGGTIVESYDVSSSNRLTFSTNTLTIDPTNNLGVGVTHFVVVPNNSVAGYTGINTYSFTSIAFAIISITPPNNATNVGIGTSISLLFTSTPVRGTGEIQIKSDNSTTGTVIETFDAASSNRISIDGNIWRLRPTNNLGMGGTFFTIIPNTAITNFTGLNTTGADALISPYKFTTTFPTLGASYEGGFYICAQAPTRWIVAPISSEVSRTFGSGDSNTTAQQVSGCTGWFVPSIGQLQNPGYVCRTYWDSYSSTFYWSGTQQHNDRAYCMSMANGSVGLGAPDAYNLGGVNCVRSFRTVTY